MRRPLALALVLAITSAPLLLTSCGGVVAWDCTGGEKGRTVPEKYLYVQGSPPDAVLTSESPVSTEYVGPVVRVITTPEHVVPDRPNVCKSRTYQDPPPQVKALPDCDAPTTGKWGRGGKCRGL